MTIKIDALDTLFFRDGKPFARGEESWADGLFPPYPSVISGALRSAYFADHPKQLQKAGKKNDPTRTLKITGLYLSIDNRPFYPMPLDLVVEKNVGHKATPTIPLTLTTDLAGVYSSPTPQLLISEADKTIEAAENAILDYYDMQEYLNGNRDEIYPRTIGDYVTPEPKVGIGRNRDTHSHEDGMLYRVSMNRLSSQKALGQETNSISLVVAYEGENFQLPESGFLRLGGEGKGAYYQKIDYPHLTMPTFSETDTFFKLVFITPAIFAQGWLPAWLKKDNLKGQLQGLPVQLIAAAIGKNKAIGGFDMANRIPKPMHYAVPAGSVYYFKIQNEGIQNNKIINTLRALNGTPLSDEPDMSAQGFGIVLVGRV